jgi:hypothetical protein
MPPELRKPVAWCLVGEQPVFLDVARDRYFTLPLPEPKCSGGNTTEGGAAGALPFSGPVRDAIACHHPAAIGSACDGPAYHVHRILALSVLFWLAGQHLALRSGSLEIALTRLSDARKQRPSVHEDAAGLHAVAATHNWTRRFLLPNDQCLVRALALARHATAAGYGIDLVFGVKLRPFEAHCWVEHQGLVLDDHLDHVRRYTPILVI